MLAYRKFSDMRREIDAPAPRNPEQAQDATLAALAALASDRLQTCEIEKGVPSVEIAEQDIDEASFFEDAGPDGEGISKNQKTAYPPAKVSKPAKVDDLEERAAIVEYDGNIPRSWAEGYAALSSMSCPHGFMPDRWRRIVNAAGYFLDCWAVHAAKSGWDALDAFGCHFARPDARFDCMGLVLLLDRYEVVGVDASGADLRTNTGTTLRFYRRKPPEGAVALWDLMRCGAS